MILDQEIPWRRSWSKRGLAPLKFPFLTDGRNISSTYWQTTNNDSPQELKFFLLPVGRGMRELLEWTGFLEAYGESFLIDIEQPRIYK